MSASAVVIHYEEALYQVYVWTLLLLVVVLFSAAATTSSFLGLKMLYSAINLVCCNCSWQVNQLEPAQTHRHCRRTELTALPEGMIATVCCLDEGSHTPHAGYLRGVLLIVIDIRAACCFSVLNCLVSLSFACCYFYIIFCLWDVRYTAIHSWVRTLGILVEGGWSGGWSDGWRSGGMCPWLVDKLLSNASSPPSLSPTCIVMECSDRHQSLSMSMFSIACVERVSLRIQ